MGSIVTAEANAVLDSSVGGTAYTLATTPIKMRLIVTGGTASSATVAGTEASGGSYSSQTITFAAASAGSKASNAVVTYAGMPICTVHSIELWDSASTPIRRWWGNLNADKTLGSGDTLSFASGAVTIALS
jgi:hypothetical protein